MFYEYHNPKAGLLTERTQQCELLMFVPDGAGAADKHEIKVLDAKGDGALTEMLDFTEGLDAFGLTWCSLPPPRSGLWRVQVVALCDADDQIAVLQVRLVERARCPVVL